MIIEAMSSAPLRSHFAETLHQKSQRRRYVLLLQKREMKDYCVGLIKNVLFCLQFPPRLLSLHPLSESLDGVTALGASQRQDKCRK